MKTEEKAFALAQNPTELFGGSINAMGSIDREELSELQLTALQRRFRDLRDRIPMLTQLADNQGIDEINALEDVIPLLFEHSIYKSYPRSYLEKGRFNQLNRWLNKLTTHDISDLDVSGCQSLDDWLTLMDERTPLRITCSSGTTGTMSFVPHSQDEFDMLGKSQTMTLMQKFGELESVSNEPMHVIHPHFRFGFNGMLRLNDITVKHLLKGEEYFHSAYPGRMSMDVLYLAARIRHAQSKGTLDRLQIGDALKARQKEFEQLEKEMPARLDEFYNSIFAQLEGKRVWVRSSWNVMHSLALAGLRLGQKPNFAPGSIIASGGGAKGMKPPENWQEDVCRFFNVDSIMMAYGMSEVFGNHRMCEHGRYHIVPWVIPFVLDPDTSELLPRRGVVTGRAAFFGLMARHAWGGVITGDEITIDWDNECACGQSTLHLGPSIQRYSDKTDDGDKITCTATPDAHQEAMSFLANLDR